MASFFSQFIKPFLIARPAYSPKFLKAPSSNTFPAVCACFRFHVKTPQSQIGGTLYKPKEKMPRDDISGGFTSRISPDSLQQSVCDWWNARCQSLLKTDTSPLVYICEKPSVSISESVMIYSISYLSAINFLSSDKVLSEINVS